MNEYLKNLRSISLYKVSIPLFTWISFFFLKSGFNDISNLYLSAIYISGIASIFFLPILYVNYERHSLKFVNNLLVLIGFIYFLSTPLIFHDVGILIYLIFSLIIKGYLDFYFMRSAKLNIRYKLLYITEIIRYSLFFLFIYNDLSNYVLILFIVGNYTELVYVAIKNNFYMNFYFNEKIIRLSDFSIVGLNLIRVFESIVLLIFINTFSYLSTSWLLISQIVGVLLMFFLSKWSIDISKNFSLDRRISDYQSSVSLIFKISFCLILLSFICSFFIDIFPIRLMTLGMCIFTFRLIQPDITFMLQSQYYKHAVVFSNVSLLLFFIILLVLIKSWFHILTISYLLSFLSFLKCQKK